MKSLSRQILLLSGLAILASGAYAENRPSEFGLDGFNQYSDSGDSLVSVIVFMENERSQREIAAVAAAENLSRSARISTVVTRLKSYRPPGLSRVEAFLKAHSRSEVVRHWIVPSFTATLSLNDLTELHTMEGVARVLPDVSLVSFEPVDSVDAPALSAGVSGHLSMIRVPEVWAQGITGKGRLVCSFDTGVEWDHPALASKWRGNHVPLSQAWFSTITPDTNPVDRTGHGTHTTGVMVGSTPADTFGVAPDAEWIAAGVIDQGKNLSGTFSDILAAYEWALNPDGDWYTTDDVPDVINNSWGVPKGVLPPCDQTFWQAIDNVEAAGVVVIFAAGNEGPDPSSLRTPGDRASTPLNTFAVAAVMDDRSIASFSSRGPGGCDGTAVKPDISAPGYHIYSSFKGDTYKLMDGTSMAAPFISGLVALCREYNPDASVDQIKWAIANSAEDLGAAGKDNAFGYGLVDAVRMLELLPEPVPEPYLVTESIFSPETPVLPGDTSELYLTLTRTVIGQDWLIGRLISENTEVIRVLSDSAEFFFGSAAAGANTAPFQISVSTDAVHGRPVPMLLSLFSSGGALVDTVSFHLSVGFPKPGSTGEHESGLIIMTVSDFGQFGLGPGSIYNLDESGFRYNGSQNMLYEGGVILTVDDGRVASSVRDSVGKFRPSDFAPIRSLTTGWIDQNHGYHRQAEFADDEVANPIPIEIRQETIDFSSEGDEGIILLRFELHNTGFESFSNAGLGFLADFDLNTAGDQLVYDTERNFVYQFGETNRYVGLVGLDNVTSFVSMINADGKSGLSCSAGVAAILSGMASIDSQAVGDQMFVAGSGPITLAAEQSCQISLALVAGESLSELIASADRARAIYDSIALVDQRLTNLPASFELQQNFPNPFNPITTISFLLSEDMDLNLSVYNVLGQRVRQLYAGPLPAGLHAFEWDGRNTGGAVVASGIYFYRLEGGGSAQTRKMIFLK
jgi:subtilisin family serine protease